MADYYLNKTAAHIDELLEKVEGLDNYDDTEVRGLINNKVDKEIGKGLSTNDFTDAYKTELDGLDTALDGKVDKEIGKGLSTNDYTTSEKTKLNGIESGAEANVQADWNQNDSTADDYIKNKPVIPDAQIQSDWNQTNTESKDFIKNKPTLGSAASKNYTTSVTSDSNDLVTAGAVYSAVSVKADLVDGKIPAAQLPSYVDDVAEYASTAAFPATGESGKIYIAQDTNKTYRWSGSGYTEISESLALGETASTAYAGNKGRANADAIAAIKDGTNIDSFADVETALADKADKSTTYTKGQVDTSQAAQDNRLGWLERNIETIRVMMNAVLYGYRVDKNDSNPETRVSYMYDAIGMTPARMNYTTGTFDYGSWANAWFITGNKPVALKFDGTVDYELDPDDYSKKADGTDSDVSDASYAGNFMASMPTVWFKRWEDDNYEYVAISNKQITPDFYADAHDNGEGDINGMIYLPMFKGAIFDGKIRSIAGITPQGNTSGSEEKTAAEACGSGWQIWDWSKHELVSDLLTLISRSTNSQGAFGEGDTNTYVNDESQNYGKLNTGQHKVGGEWVMYGGGRFWGASDDKHHVKVFHIEDFWGNRWDRCLGLNLVNMEYVYKLVRPYALDTDSSYTSSGLTASATGYQKTQYAGRFGTFPKAIDGSQTTYVCDYFWSASGTRLGLFGGNCSNRAYCGSRCLGLDSASDARAWAIGGSPCFNPIPIIPHKNDIDAIMN